MKESGGGGGRGGIALGNLQPANSAGLARGPQGRSFPRLG